MPWCFIKFSQLILKGNVWRSVWRICMWILGLKGLMLTKDTDGLKLQQRWREAVKYPQRHSSLFKTTLIFLILRFRLGTYIPPLPPPPKKKDGQVLWLNPNIFSCTPSCSCKLNTLALARLCFLMLQLWVVNITSLITHQCQKGLLISKRQ